MVGFWGVWAPRCLREEGECLNDCLGEVVFLA